MTVNDAAGTSGVTIIGAGSLGLGLASQLCRTGSVTVLTRRSSAQAINDRGGFVVRLEDRPPSFIRSGADNVAVTWDPATIGEDDAVIFTTKGQALAGTAARVAHSWNRRHGFVLGLENGVVKDEILRETFGHQAVVGAATVLNARTDQDGTVIVPNRGTTYVGEFDPGPSARVEELRQRFNAADLPCIADFDIASVTWTKCVNAVGVFGVSALTRLATSDLMTRPDLVLAFLDLVHEAAAIATALGHRIGSFPGLPIADYLERPRQVVAAEIVERASTDQAGRPAYSSMAQDVLNGRTTEVDQVLGDLVSRATSTGVPAPRIEFAYRLVKGMTEQRAP